MAQALVDWAIRSPTDKVLDPSFGGLAFLSAAETRLRELGAVDADGQIYGVDLDDAAISEAEAFARGGATLIHRDFLQVASDGREVPSVEACVGNPPYVRYQLYDGKRGREIAELHGVALTRMASSWAPILIHATDFVAPGGRMAKVLPAELIHSQYASQVLGFLCRSFGRVIIAMFDEQVFPGAQEEVVLLLADGRGDHAPGIEVLTFSDLSDINIPSAAGPTVHVDAEHKLLVGLLDPLAVEAYDELRIGELTRRLGDLASVDIGAVTGANSWFVRSAMDVADVPAHMLRPTVSRAVHVPGARLREADLLAMDDDGVPTRMLVLEPKQHTAHLEAVQRLIDEGEAAGIHERYKCRIRAPWYALPASQVADPPHLFLTYMNSDVPRLVANDAGALSTNNLHGVRLRNGTDPRALAVSFYSSLTMLSAELVGRSYGGGVLKLEPTEAERLVVPRPCRTHRGLLSRVDDLLRRRRYDELTTLVDQAILVDDLGVSSATVERLRAAAERLRRRRKSRSRKAD
jgi:adenine-specific DNA methylase